MPEPAKDGIALRELVEPYIWLTGLLADYLIV